MSDKEVSIHDSPDEIRNSMSRYIRFYGFFSTLDAKIDPSALPGIEKGYKARVESNDPEFAFEDGLFIRSGKGSDPVLLLPTPPKHVDKAVAKAFPPETIREISLEYDSLVYQGLAKNELNPLKPTMDQLRDSGKDESLERTITQQARPTRFAATISHLALLPLNEALGGPNSLTIDTEEVGPNGWSKLILHGAVDVRFPKDVPRQISKLTRLFGGLLIASGLARFFPYQSHRDGEITIEGQDQPLVHEPEAAALVAGLSVGICEELIDEFFETQVKSKGVEAVIAPRLTKISRLLTASGNENQSLKSAAMLLSEACTAPEAGKGIAFALISLEATLLDKSKSDSITARLTEAVAYRLGRSADERVKIRKRVKDLYNCRSRFVHGGFTESDELQRNEAIEMACQVIRKEIDELL